MRDTASKISRQRRSKPSSSQGAGFLKKQGACTILWSIARLGLKPPLPIRHALSPYFFDEDADGVPLEDSRMWGTPKSTPSRRMDEFSVEGVAMCMWALGRMRGGGKWGEELWLGKREDSWHQGVDVGEPYLDGVGAGGEEGLMPGRGVAGRRGGLRGHAMRLMAEAGPQSVANMLWASANAQQVGGDREFVEELLQTVVKVASRMEEHHVAMSLGGPWRL